MLSNGYLICKIRSSISSSVCYPCFKRLETWYFLQAGIEWELLNFFTLCSGQRETPLHAEISTAVWTTLRQMSLSLAVPEGLAEMKAK